MSKFGDLFLNLANLKRVKTSSLRNADRVNPSYLLHQGHFKNGYFMFKMALNFKMYSLLHKISFEGAFKFTITYLAMQNKFRRIV